MEMVIAALLTNFITMVGFFIIARLVLLLVESGPATWLGISMRARWIIMVIVVVAVCILELGILANSYSIWVRAHNRYFNLN